MQRGVGKTSGGMYRFMSYAVVLFLPFGVLPFRYTSR
jgi:hypothetical protein